MKAKELNTGNRLKPAKTCVICNKSLAEVGGWRLVAQHLRGVKLSDKFQGGGNKDYPHQSFKLNETSDKYVVVWGEKSKWTIEAIQRVIDQYNHGFQPWFCQVCGQRVCSKCGAPINYPMGSDILENSGCKPHVPILPINPGCINSVCSEYKDFMSDRQKSFQLG